MPRKERVSCEATMATMTRAVGAALALSIPQPRVHAAASSAWIAARVVVLAERRVPGLMRELATADDAPIDMHGTRRGFPRRSGDTECASAAALEWSVQRSARRELNRHARTKRSRRRPHRLDLIDAVRPVSCAVGTLGMQEESPRVGTTQRVRLDESPAALVGQLDE